MLLLLLDKQPTTCWGDLLVHCGWHESPIIRCGLNDQQLIKISIDGQRMLIHPKNEKIVLQIQYSLLSK